MSQDAEVDMKDVELNEVVDPEKQPMTGGETGNGDANSPLAEKNGSVKVKIPDEKEEKFTGLSKEQLLQVAGTPGWIRIRWAMLILFWLGWIGMLAGAVAIIVQAPRCKPIPKLSWWNMGPLYQIGDVDAFTTRGLAGLKDDIKHVGSLKMKGLIVGPIHVSNQNKPEDLNLEEISSNVGNQEQMANLIHEATRKSIAVVLDLTPNYKGSEPWFSSEHVTSVAEKVLSAADYWLKKGVKGILLYDVETVAAADPLFWPRLRETVKSNESERVLIGVTNEMSPDKVSSLLSSTGVDLMLSRMLENMTGVKVAEAVELLYSSRNQSLGAWNIGNRIRGHLASVVGAPNVKLSQLLLTTLPGTPVFNYGDEMGLEDEDSVYPKMVWNLDKAENDSQQVKKDSLSFFKTVNELREKDNSIKFGDYVPLHNSSQALAYLRSWDQDHRYIVALNWDQKNSVTLELTDAKLPTHATVVISTDAKATAEASVQLSPLTLEPQQGLLLKFPYTV